MSRADELTPGGRRTAEISTSVVRILARYTGRGPTKARTLTSDGIVVVPLEETLTPTEHTLVQLGREELARAARLALQGAAREELIAVVEQAAGHSVRALLMATEMEADIAALLFLLQPADG